MTRNIDIQSHRFATHQRDIPAAAKSNLARLRAWFVHLLFTRLLRSAESQLHFLSAQQLKDIGLTPNEAWAIVEEAKIAAQWHGPPIP